jgi:glycosyltransferase involved in cell wall biosynthesis
VSVVIPAVACDDRLRKVVPAVRANRAGLEIIVVFDDGAIPPGADALGPDVRLDATGARLAGQSVARNRGAAMARADIVLFVDSDVEPHPGAVDRVVARLRAEPGLAAVFGSYDDAPPEPGFASQFKNLQHHHVHQSSPGKVPSFWTGLGAVRRDVFLALGGLDPRIRFLEDIEFGLRLTARGHEVALDPGLLGAHLKRWTLGSLIATDFKGRALPWSRLILGTRRFPNCLNVGWRHRAGVAAAWAAAGAVAAGFLWRPAWAAAGLLALAALACERGLLRFLLARRGGWFAVRAGLMILVQQLYSGLAFLVACATWRGRPAAP